MPVKHSKFEQLPNEILIIIFSFMKTKNLYQIFKNLNQRFNTIIGEVDHYINFEEYTKKEYREIVMTNEDAFSVHQIVSLTIFDDKNQYDVASFNTVLFFSKYQQSHFPKLKSLTINGLTLALFSKLSISILRQLVTLSISASTSPPTTPRLVQRLFKLLFATENFDHLKKLSLNFDFETNRPDPDSWCGTRESVEDITLPFSAITQQQPSITCLIIKHRVHDIDLVHLLKYLPNLKFLSTTLVMYPNLSALEKCSNLTSLELDVTGIELTHIEEFLFQMFPNLSKSLTVDFCPSPHIRGEISEERLQKFFQNLSEKINKFMIHIKHEEQDDENGYYFQEYETEKYWIRFELTELNNEYYGDKCGTRFYNVLK
ncbi:unnamed protein product [Rotaria sp. Silwood1]|nr:unnamed protein product [Rotaria sp. Silwood1]